MLIESQAMQKDEPLPPLQPILGTEVVVYQPEQGPMERVLRSILSQRIEPFEAMVTNNIFKEVASGLHIEEVGEIIGNILTCEGKNVLEVVGPQGSGKTTFVERIKNRLAGSEDVHLDDDNLPGGKCTRTRVREEVLRGEPGVDIIESTKDIPYHRIKISSLLALGSEERMDVKEYDPQTGLALDESNHKKTTKKGPVHIVLDEGIADSLKNSGFNYLPVYLHISQENSLSSMLRRGDSTVRNNGREELAKQTLVRLKTEVPEMLKVLEYTNIVISSIRTRDGVYLYKIFVRDGSPLEKYFNNTISLAA